MLCICLILLLKYNENGFKNKLRQTDFAPLVYSSTCIRGDSPSIYSPLFSLNNAAGSNLFKILFLDIFECRRDHVLEFLRSCSGYCRVSCRYEVNYDPPTPPSFQPSIHLADIFPNTLTVSESKFK